MATTPEPVDIPDWLWRGMICTSVIVVIFSIVLTAIVLGT